MVCQELSVPTTAAVFASLRANMCTKWDCAMAVVEVGSHICDPGEIQTFEVFGTMRMGTYEGRQRDE